MRRTGRDTPTRGRGRERERRRLPAPLTLGVLVLTVGGAAAACGRSATPPSLSTLVGAGSAAFKQGDYNGAVQLFERALKQAPNDPTAHYDLGTVYQALKNNPNALTQYARALREDPSLVPAMFNEATIDTVHDPTLAALLYRRVISLQADSPSAYLNLGLLEAQQGQRSQAGFDLRKAIHLDPALRRDIPPAVAPDLAAPPPRTPKGSAPTTASSVP